MGISGSLEVGGFLIKWKGEILGVNGKGRNKVRKRLGGNLKRCGRGNLIVLFYIAGRVRSGQWFL